MKVQLHVSWDCWEGIKMLLSLIAVEDIQVGYHQNCTLSDSEQFEDEFNYLSNLEI